MLSWPLLCAANVAAAQLRLGVMYEHGLGVKLDYKVQTALNCMEETRLISAGLVVSISRRQLTKLLLTCFL